MAEETDLANVRGMSNDRCYNTLLYTVIEQSLNGEVSAVCDKTFGEIVFEGLKPQVDLLQSTVSEFDFDLETALEMQLNNFRGVKNETQVNHTALKDGACS